VFLGGGVVGKRHREARCGVAGGTEEKLSHGPRSQRCTKYALIAAMMVLLSTVKMVVPIGSLAFSAAFATASL
jgi:hypothetical protein